MKNNETIWDVLFTDTTQTEAVHANIMVSGSNPNPFVTGQWLCPNCHYKFIKDVTKEPTTDSCPNCNTMVEFDLAHLYQEAELREHWRMYISTPIELRRRHLYD